MKKFALLSILLCLVNQAFSQQMDFGLITENLSTLNTSDEVSGLQINTQRLWTSYDSPQLKFNLQGRFTTNLTWPNGELTTDPDLEILNIQWLGLFQSDSLKETNILLGRFAFKDASRLVFSGTTDGVLLSFLGAPWTTRLGLGYNGLLGKKSSQMVMTNSDVTDMSNPEIFFASPRALGLIEATWAPSTAYQFTFAYIPQLDLRQYANAPGRTLLVPGDTQNNSEGGIFNTHYGMIDLKGTIKSGIYYDLGASLYGGSTLYLNTNGVYALTGILGAATTGSMEWYLKDSLNTNFHFQAWYSTGDGSERTNFSEGSIMSNDVTGLSLYKSLSNLAPGYVFTPQLGNLSAMEITYNIRLLASQRSADGLAISVTGRTFLRVTDGPLSSSRVMLGVGGNYLGTEGVIGLRYRPMSDLSISLTTGLFLPSYTGSMENSSAESKTALYLSLSL